MAYPRLILDALASRPCPGCDRELRPAYVVSVQVRPVVDDSHVRTGLRSLVNLICPCGRRGVFDMQLDRDDLDAVIRELRLRGNAPPSRREPQQVFVPGPPVRSRGSVQPSNRTAPDRPMDDQEVAHLLRELEWFDFKITSSGFVEMLCDLLIVQDLSRLTRGGVVTGNHLQYRLAEAGIELLLVQDEHLGGDLGEIHATLKYMASQQQAKAIALAVTRGRIASIERGDTPPIARPPYGIDRLIVGKDGQARYILHLTADGVQLKMNPRTREVVGTFGRQDGRGSFRGARQHYRKQDDEIVLLVQGEPAQVAHLPAP